MSDTARPETQPASATTPPKTQDAGPKKTRRVRRRGARARGGIEEEDDLVERAALSDEDSDPESSGPDTEDEEEGEEHPQQPVSQATGPSTAPGAAAENTGPPANPSTAEPADEAPVVAKHNWAQEMNDDDLNHDATLPVIDFADLPAHVEALSASATAAKPPADTKGKGKARAKPPKSAAPKAVASKPVPASPSEPVAAEPGPSQDKPAASEGRTKSARETYMHRLSTDPSYVPVVGQFWGHDDRLMNKDLRGMSDWWRERGRGRGRGGFGGRGGRGGRGGFYGPPHGANGVDPNAPQSPQADASPVERQWSHDGFEEMAKAEDAKDAGRGRRGGFRIQPSRSWFRGNGRGRGGQGAVNRGNAPGSSQRQADGASAGVPSGREGQQPTGNTTATTEEIITKTAEQSHVEASEVVVKVPGSSKNNAAAGPSNDGQSAKPAPLPKKDTRPPRVNLPKKNGKAPPTPRTPVAPAALTSAPASTQSAAPATSPPSGPQDTAGSTRPQQTRAPPKAKAIPPPKKRRESGPVVSTARQGPAAQADAPQKDDLALPTAPQDQAKPAEEPQVSTNGATHDEGPSGAPPPPLPIVPPTAVAAPGPYGSGYAYAALPPGIAMGESGMLYEVASGRPVILSPPTATPPPTVPMFTPRPVLHSHIAHRSSGGSISYLPPHVHPSMTPDFSTPPPPPHMMHPRFPQEAYGYSPSTPHDNARATPPKFFAPPRQSGRLEIKSPTNNGGRSGPSGTHAHTSSTTSDHNASGHHGQDKQPAPAGAHFSGSSHGQPISPTNPSYAPGAVYAAPGQYYGGYYGTPDPNGHYPSMEPRSVPSNQPAPTQDDLNMYAPGYGGFYPAQPYPAGYVNGGDYRNPYAEMQQQQQQQQDGTPYNPYAAPVNGQTAVYY